jgi:hypothetical protein
MSGSFHSYNTEPSNFNFQVEKYASPYGKIEGVGCDGTKSGVDATLPTYSSPFKVGGSSGYSFTDVPVGPVAGPKAPYSIIEKYDDNRTRFRNEFAPEFHSSLKGGASRRKKVQYGCMSKTRGGSRGSKRSGHKCSGHKCSGHKCSGHKRSSRKRSGGKRSTQKNKYGGSKKRSIRRRRTMRGGMTSASDYTEGRDTSQDQPYGNKGYSFGQGLSSMLNANTSYFANPPPVLPYNDCGKVMRN